VKIVVIDGDALPVTVSVDALEELDAAELVPRKTAL
jgi:hypothetical protein